MAVCVNCTTVPCNRTKKSCIYICVIHFFIEIEETAQVVIKDIHAVNSNKSVALLLAAARGNISNTLNCSTST